MRKIIIILIFLNYNIAYAKDDIFSFVESAFKNNPRMNAERENFKAQKENINISRSEFLPSITISGSETSTESSNRTNQSGAALKDTNLNSQSKSISVDQKIFQGFENLNSLKKSQLELEKAKNFLRNVEQEIILDTATVIYDLVFKSKSLNFNLANVDLFERQVESDKARLQKGEISLTDLAQSESSLAGANANLITAQTDFINLKTKFEKITRTDAPDELRFSNKIKLNLPSNLSEAIRLSEQKNPKLLIAKLDAKIAEKNLDIERSKLSPSASINFTKSENEDFSTTVDEVDEEKLKATITWPIIKGGKNFSTIKKFSYQKEESLLLLDDIKNEVKSETTNSWSNYKSSQGVLSATEAQLKAAEIANEGITLEYDSGNTRTTLELIQSRSLLLDARISHARAERDFIVSQFKLLVQIGSLSLDSVKSL